jgi:hypothetical protein
MFTVLEKNLGGKIKVQMESETGTSTLPARILIYNSLPGKVDMLVLEITAKIERKPGADGAFYNCVTLEKK